MRRAAALGVVVALSGCGGSAGTSGGSSASFVYGAHPVPQTPVVNASAIERAVNIIRGRAQAFGLAGVRVSSGPAPNEVSIKLTGVEDPARTAGELSANDQLAFYDWEANLVTPNGKTVASQLRSQNPLAVQMSQGGGENGAGAPGLESVPLYDAVRLAARVSGGAARDNGRIGAQYYLFGEGGSPACASAAKAQQVAAAGAGAHCLLSGPALDQRSLRAALPPGVAISDGKLMIVKQGMVVLQAVASNFATSSSIADPQAEFYVLHDHAALSSADVITPTQSTDPSGHPDVVFEFTPSGQTAFHHTTAVLARRGAINSALSLKLPQHFAVALDQRLITVPFVDYQQYPDGIPAQNGAVITGGFTTRSARELATEMRLGSLPVSLALVQSSR